MIFSSQVCSPFSTPAAYRNAAANPRRELRILDEDVRLGRAARGELQQELDTQTGSANAGFAAENLGVGDDEIFSTMADRVSRKPRGFQGPIANRGSLPDRVFGRHS